MMLIGKRQLSRSGRAATDVCVIIQIHIEGMGRRRNRLEWT